MFRRFCLSVRCRRQMMWEFPSLTHHLDIWKIWCRHLISIKTCISNTKFPYFEKFVQILWRIDRKGKQSKISIEIFFHNFTYSCGVEKGIHNFLNRVKIFIEKEKLFFLLLLLFNDGTILESRNKKMTKLLIREKKIFFFPFFFFN